MGRLEKHFKACSKRKKKITKKRFLALFLAAVIQVSVHAEGLSVFVKDKAVTKKMKITKGEKVRLSVKYDDQDVQPQEVVFKSSKRRSPP